LPALFQFHPVLAILTLDETETLDYYFEYLEFYILFINFTFASYIV